MQPPRLPRVVDDVTVRLIAAVVLVLAVLALATHQWWLYAVLAVDFALRATLGPRVSPLAQLVQRAIRPRLQVPACPTAGPPKRFAASIGAVLTAAATLLWLLPGTAAAPAVVVLGVVMVVFPALEAVLGLCVGCRVFGLLMRMGVVPEEVCLECADISLRRRSVSGAR